MPVTSIIRATTDAANGQLPASPNVPSSISADGTKVLMSVSTSLTAADTNGVADTYLKDLVTGAVTLVSADSGGVVGNAASIPTSGVMLSADGSKAVFYSTATNLVAGDTNGAGDLFVKTLSGAGAGDILRINTTSVGGQSTGGITSGNRVHITADGTKVLFASGASDLVAGDTNGTVDLFLKTVSGAGAGDIVRVSTDGLGAQIVLSDAMSAMSADGTKIAFVTTAALAGDDTNGVADIYVKDLGTGAVTRASTATGNVEVAGAVTPTGLAFSADGSKLAFVSSNANLVAGDTNAANDIFVKTLSGAEAGKLERASTTSAGAQMAGGAGGDGGYIAFSNDNRLVFGTTSAGVASDTNGSYDVYVKSLSTGALEVVSTNPAGVLSTTGSYFATFASNASKVLFYSDSTNLVAGDTNGVADLFVVTLGAVAGPPPATPPPPAPPPSISPTLTANFSQVFRYLTYSSTPVPATVTTPSGLVLPNPLLEQQKAVRDLIAKVDAGQMTLRQAQDAIVDLADGTTSVPTMTYQFFVGRVPTREGLDYLVSSPENPNDLNDGYYAGMSLENRYINFAVNLGKVGEGRASFQAGYGDLSIPEAAAKAYTAIFGVAPQPGKIADILNATVSFAGQSGTRLDYLTSLGGDAIGTKAAIAGFLLAEAAKSDVGPYAVSSENFLYDLLDGTAAFGASLDIYLNAGPRYFGLIGEA